MNLKHKKQPFNLIAAIKGESFDFISPMPIAQCAELLLARSERATGMFASRQHVRINVWPAPSVYRFKMQQDIGRNVNIRTKGTLTPVDASSTRVTGKSEFGLLERVLFIFVMPVFGVIFFVTTPFQGFTFVVFFVVGYPLMLALMVVEISKMTKIVYDVLSEY